MHAAAFNYVKAHTKGKWGKVVEFGGRDVNGTVRGAIKAGEYLSIDITDGPGVDLVADAAKWDGKGQYDLVVCCETLEHADEAAAIVKSAGRALKPGGTFVLTAACDPRDPHSAIDGGPLRKGEFYRNLDKRNLRVAWATVGDIVWDREAGDVRATFIKKQRQPRAKKQTAK